MAITRDRKVELLAKAREIFANSPTAVFVSATGLRAGEAATMRSEMIKSDVRYAVIKKTLVNKALEESAVEGERPALDGELAIAYGSDLIAPARAVREFEKKHQGTVAIVGGVFDGKYMDKQAMSEIANIPDMHSLRGMFVNIINTPIQQLVSGLHAVAEKQKATA